AAAPSAIRAIFRREKPLQSRSSFNFLLSDLYLGLLESAELRFKCGLGRGGGELQRTKRMIATRSLGGGRNSASRATLLPDVQSMLAGESRHVKLPDDLNKKIDFSE